jgi:mannosyltransferase OCH1-like enzyme
LNLKIKKAISSNNENKFIHYIWFGNNNLPDFFSHVHDSWKAFATDYQIIRWTERELPLDINYYSKLCWDNKWYGHLSDYFRIYVVYHYGGLYLDIDLELREHVKGSFLEDDYFVYVKNEDGIRNYGSGWSFRASKHDHNLLNLLNAYNNFPKIHLTKYLKIPVWTDVTFMSPYLRQSLSKDHSKTLEVEYKKLESLIFRHHSASWVPQKEILRSNYTLKNDNIKEISLIRGYIITYGFLNGLLSLLSRFINSLIMIHYSKKTLK